MMILLKYLRIKECILYYSTIYAFKAFGMQQENVKLQNPIQQDPARPQIRFTTMSWNPTIADIGRHVVCVKVNDSNG
jgi:hypothetical protein